MNLKIFFSIIFFFIVTGLLIFYWFIPSKTIEFGEFNIKTGSYNSNFSLLNESADMQFYSNMRYPDKRISYKIDNCPLQKEDEMERAFEIIENLTVLDFYSADNNEEISVGCESGNKMQGGLFIAGEGGPTNITEAGNFSVILYGQILLIRESNCENPNVALHELLHALGFGHSLNKNNIMYEVTKCKQTIGSQIPELINELYSYPRYPDLVFENVSAKMQGMYLDVNMTVKNNGLKNSETGKIRIYADGKLVKEMALENLEIGYGRMIELKNIFVKKLNVEKLEFFVDYNFDELDKENNKIILEIKK